MLKYLILLLFPAFTLAQSPSTPCRDSVDIWMDLLSRDSLIYRPEGDSLITLIAKSENKRGILFLLDHLHKRDDKYAPMFGDMQIDSKQKHHIELELSLNCDRWILFSCVLSYIKNAKYLEYDKLIRFEMLLLTQFTNNFLKELLHREYLHTADEKKRKNILELSNVVKKI